LCLPIVLLVPEEKGREKRVKKIIKERLGVELP
jgi:vacuolar-type H+-ATPase subunit F/Vma7